MSNSFGFVFLIVFKASGHEKRVSITCFLLYAAIKRIRMATALSVFSAIVFLCCCCCPFQSLLFLRSGFYFCCSVDFKTQICRRTSLTKCRSKWKAECIKTTGKKSQPLMEKSNRSAKCVCETLRKRDEKKFDEHFLILVVCESCLLGPIKIESQIENAAPARIRVHSCCSFFFGITRANCITPS